MRKNINKVDNIIKVRMTFYINKLYERKRREDLKMEMTIEQREKYNEYQRDYRRNNSKRINEYQREYRENNADKFKGYREKAKSYHQLYYIEHKEHMLETARRWREANKGDFVYFYINEDGENIYIGSTSRPLVERNSFHLKNHSNLNMSAKDLVNDHNLECILFKNFNEYNLSREDLYFLEKYFIEEQGGILNKQCITINEENLTRSIQELIEISKNTEYKEFKKLDKYLN